MSRTTLPAAFALAASLGLALGGEAEAHAHLRSAKPAVDGTVSAAPSELDLEFSEGVTLAFTGLTLTGPAGTAIPTGGARLGPGGDAALVVPLLGPLGPGAYRVDWHALAVDGHKTAGSYGFTVRP